MTADGPRLRTSATQEILGDGVRCPDDVSPFYWRRALQLAQTRSVDVQKLDAETRAAYDALQVQLAACRAERERRAAAVTQPEVPVSAVSVASQRRWRAAHDWA